MHRDAATFKRGMKQNKDEERDHEACEGGQIARDPEEAHGLMK